MQNAEHYFESIDAARIQRVKELSEVKRAFRITSVADPLSLASKAVVVLTYANWEGFYNDCVDIYLDFLRQAEAKVVDASWLLLVGALSGEFDRLRNRNHSAEARKEFIDRLKNRLTCGFEDFDRKVVAARSNLDFLKLSSNLILLDLDYSIFQSSRIRIDKELVNWRHSVAHGDTPDLSAVDVSDHVDFAANLMLLVSDLFQNAILNRLSLTT